MTSKSIIDISFTEIEKVEITCSKCGAALIFPVSQKNLVERFPPSQYKCPGCGTELWMGETDLRFQGVVAIIKSLRIWQESGEKGFRLSFSMIAN